MTGDDPFRQIEKEVAALNRTSGRPSTKPASRQITPIPETAPGMPAHPSHGRPAAKWAYRDSEGGLLGYVLRFETTNGKEIRPLTWRDGGRGPHWAWEGFDDPRPLYGLDLLTARPTAPVLVVEGEKTADAARMLFPTYVVVTWPGGAKAVVKVDFGPLAARSVTIWPDADRPGRDAARAVAKALRAAGNTSMLIVELPASLPAGWDLADGWMPTFGRLEAEAAINAATASGRPVPPTADADASGLIWPIGYRMDPASGLWWEGRVRNGTDQTEWICDSFDVVGEARDSAGKGWSVVVRVTARDGAQSPVLIPRAGLANGGNEARTLLADAGMTMATNQGLRDKLTIALMRVRAKKFITLTDATGWHDGRFVLPDRTIGRGAGDEVLFTGEASALKYAVRGKSEDWRRDVAGRAKGNPLLIFALSCAFAPPLLRLLGAEGGGFHFRGNSSSGKSTLLVAAGSVWGGDPNGGQTGFGHAWKATANALESLAMAHNDTLLCLDEFAQVDPNEAGGAAYALANGEGKRRLRSDGSLRPAAKWLLLFLSSGEIGLADHMASAPKPGRAATGQELRLIDIAADAGRDMGIWETIEAHEAPAERSDALKGAARSSYGHAGPKFLSEITADVEAILKIAGEYVVDFRGRVARAEDSGQISRAIGRFAIIAAAGELAAGFGIVPWEPGDVSSAVADIFERWATGFGRKGLREERQAILKVKGYIDTHPSSFAKIGDADEEDFPRDSVRENESRSMMTVGYRFKKGGEIFYLFTPEGAAEVLRGFNVIESMKTLNKAGYLETEAGGGRLTKKKSHNGNKISLYWVRSSIVEHDPE